MLISEDVMHRGRSFFSICIRSTNHTKPHLVSQSKILTSAPYPRRLRGKYLHINWSDGIKKCAFLCSSMLKLGTQFKSGSKDHFDYSNKRNILRGGSPNTTTTLYSCCRTSWSRVRLVGDHGNLTSY